MSIDEFRKLLSATVEETAKDWETEGWWGEAGPPTSPNMAIRYLHARLDAKLGALQRQQN